MTDRVLGHGGMGVVTRLFDSRLSRWTARKRAFDPSAFVPTASRQSRPNALLEEARLLAYLDHPGVVPIYDAAVEGSYTMKPLTGPTLRERLSAIEGEGELLSVAEALQIFRRLAETMANAHARGVVHLDLKPENLMLGSHGQVVVIDWGLARFFDEAFYRAHLGDMDAPVPGSRSEPVCGGTLAYMPVEQFFAPESVGPASDIFAAGTLLYRMLTGLLPFDPDGTVAQVAFRKAARPPATPSSLRPGIPKALSDLVMMMMKPDAAARPESFDAVVSHLDQLTVSQLLGRILTLSDGDVLFEAGDEGLEAWQILEGRVAIVDRAGRRLAERGAGEIIGEMAVLSNRPRSATVRALGRCRVRAVAAADIEAELDKVDPLIGQIVRSLSARLRQTMDDDSRAGANGGFGE